MPKLAALTGRWRVWPHLVVLALSAAVLTGVPSDAGAAPLPGFQLTNVINGLDTPTALRFAPSPDTRVFVAEKSGLIKVFDDLSDTTPTIFADLSTSVYNFYDRGLLDIELDPSFPTRPYVYALYTYDADIGGTAPKWGTPGVLSDPCPDPPGGAPHGCPASARLSRLTAAGDQMVPGSERVLVEDWCQQGPTHSIGTAAFGPDGGLYVGGGDAAANNLDWGQNGIPVTNPCGDPPGGVGGTMQPPTSEGGSLRSQDLRTPSDPTTLDGTIIRVDPDTGAPLPSNPLFVTGSDTNAKRIVAYGLRNPFRFTFRPGTNEIWIGDVGDTNWEEIDRITNPIDSTVENFGWPCYEGSNPKSGFDVRNFTICENLYVAPSGQRALDPFFSYRHAQPVSSADTCSTTGGVISGITFYEGGNYPASYDGALFFADYGRSCIWSMPLNQNGQPDRDQVSTFVSNAGFPVDLQVGPGGDLFYVDIGVGRVRRVQFFGSDQPPTAAIDAVPPYGPLPLTVNFDGTGSSDPEAGALTYEWDLDGDGQFDDSTAPQPSFVYTQAIDYTVGLRVTDPAGNQDTGSVVISAGNTPPTAIIDQPSEAFTWHVGEPIAFSGRGTDAQQGNLPASALTWHVNLQHCPQECHIHPLSVFPGQASGSFAAIDHEYPSHYELQLTVTDNRGLSSTAIIELQPETTTLTMQSSPPGLQVGLNDDTLSAPFSRTVIVGSSNSIIAPTPQTQGTSTYGFSSWSDGGTQIHTVIAPSAPTTTYTATYAIVPPQPPAAQVSVTDTAFSPNTVTIPFGGTVRWNFTGAGTHAVTDNSRMLLYDSGPRSQGSTYDFTYVGAGAYPYRCGLHSSVRGTVRVPVTALPEVGGVSTTYNVAWASGAPPAGYVFDIQVKRPGSSAFVDWRTGQTTTSAGFLPDAGAGGYVFQARLRNTANGRASDWSPTSKIRAG